jgi:hypothetical protein
VQIGNSAADRNLELVNTGASAVDVGGWEVVVGAASFAIPAGTSIGAGGFLTLHADVGTDDVDDLFSVAALSSLTTAGGVLLYQTPSSLTLSHFIRDAIKWGVGDSGEDQAVFAGQWPSIAAGEYVDTTGLNEQTGTISRTPGANTESKGDWYVEDTPTLGAANAP